MTRMSKQGERRHISPKRPRFPSPKTGPRKDDLAKGYKEHVNASGVKGVFIGKVKEVSRV